MKNTLQNIMEKNSGSVLFAYLFGSHAQGSVSMNSDIDIAVFFKDDVEESLFNKKIDLYLQLSRTLERDDIDVIIMNNFKNIIILHNIVSHGVVVYCEDEDKRLDYEQRIIHSAIDFKTQRYMAMGI